MSSGTIFDYTCIAIPTSFKETAKNWAYRFDGSGGCFVKDWDFQSKDNDKGIGEIAADDEKDGGIGEIAADDEKDGGIGEITADNEGVGTIAAKEFSGYRVILPRVNKKPYEFCKELINIACPPLSLAAVAALMTDGSFCGLVDEAIIFRMNSMGSPENRYTLKFAGRIIKESLISVSLGIVDGMDYRKRGRDPSLCRIPFMGSYNPRHYQYDPHKENELEHLLYMKEEFMYKPYCLEDNSPIPKSIGSLVIDMLDMFAKDIEKSTNALGLEWKRMFSVMKTGDTPIKKKLLNLTTFRELKFNMLHILEVIGYCDKVFPRLKLIATSRGIFTKDDGDSLDGVIARLSKEKDLLSIYTDCLEVSETTLDSWGSNRTNKHLYVLTVIGIIFVPLSLISAVFGMNVGGIPWTNDNDPKYKHGFFRFILLAVAALLISVLLFFAPNLYDRVRDLKMRRWLKTRRRDYMYSGAKSHEAGREA